MYSNSLDFNQTVAQPLTLDGLQSVSADAFSFVGQPDGVLQLDANDQVYSSDTVTLTNIEGRNNLITLDDNVYGVGDLTITGTIYGTTGRFLTLSANSFEVLSFSATNLSSLNLTSTNIAGNTLNITGNITSLATVRAVNFTGTTATFTNLQVSNITGVAIQTNVLIATGNITSLGTIRGANFTGTGATFTNLQVQNFTGVNGQLTMLNVTRVFGGGCTFTNIQSVNAVATSATYTNIDIRSNIAYSGTFKTPITASRALVTDTNSNVIAGSANALEISYLTGLTDNVQYQIDNIAQSNWLTWGNNIYNKNGTGNVGIGTSGPNKEFTVSGNVLIGNPIPWNNNDSTVNMYLTPLNSSNICSIAVQTTFNSQHLLYFEPALHTIAVSGQYNIQINGNTRQTMDATRVKTTINGNQSVELGADTANVAYIDFHSQSVRETDYDARIIALGGDTATGRAQLNFIANTFAFNNLITITGGINISGGNLAITGNLNQTGTHNLYKQSADTVSQTVSFYKSRGATTPANSGDTLGRIEAYGLNFTATAYNRSCNIDFQQNLSATGNAGRMIFQTRNTDTTETEKLRIDNNPIFGYNASGWASSSLYFNGVTNDGANGLRIHPNSNGNVYIDYKGTGKIIWRGDNTSGATERSNFDFNNGYFNWGTTALQILNDGQISVANMSGSATDPFVRRNPTNKILTIDTSDRRIKKNFRVLPFEFWKNKVKELKPQMFDLHPRVDNGKRDVIGFIAQDLEEFDKHLVGRVDYLINKCDLCKENCKNHPEGECENPDKCECLELKDALTVNQIGIIPYLTGALQGVLLDYDNLQRELIAERIQYKTEKDRMMKQIAKLRTDLDNVIRVLKLRGFSL